MLKQITCSQTLRPASGHSSCGLRFCPLPFGAHLQQFVVGTVLGNHGKNLTIEQFQVCILQWTLLPNGCHQSSVPGPPPESWNAPNVGCRPPTSGYFCFRRNCQPDIIRQFNHPPLRITSLYSGRRSSLLPIITHMAVLFTSTASRLTTAPTSLATLPLEQLLIAG